MKQINRENSVRPTPDARTYLDVLTKQGVFRRMIDAYAFAAAYAVINDLQTEEILSKGRQDLVRDLRLLDDDVLLSLEAGIYAIRKRKGKPEPNDGKELLEILTQYAEVGLKVLKQQWEDKSPSQIQDHISKIIQSSLS